jgi:hypothetical protein
LQQENEWVNSEVDRQQLLAILKARTSIFQAPKRAEDSAYFDASIDCLV